MLISVAQHGYNVVTNPHHPIEKILKKLSENVFPTNYMKKDSAKHHVAWAKTSPAF